MGKHIYPNTILPELVGEVLREERKRLGLTLEHVGTAIGRGKGYAFDCERRANKGMTVGRLELVAGALGLTASEVLRRAEQRRFRQHPALLESQSEGVAV